MIRLNFGADTQFYCRNRATVIDRYFSWSKMHHCALKRQELSNQLPPLAFRPAFAESGVLRTER
jgi:hypothetical protein